MILGSVNVHTSEDDGNPQEGDTEAEDNNADIVKEELQKDQQKMEELKKLQLSGQQLQTELSQLAIPGASIVDKKDGKTIGKIISTPAPGTNVLLAQMRLDRLGLLGNNQKWSRTNKILIGDSTKEYRYLPYLPLWWPEIDGNTGKEKIVDEKEEDGDELDEL